MTMDSYLAEGNESIWSVLVKDVSFFDICRAKDIFFSLIGDADKLHNSHIALVVTNNSKTKFTRQAWNLFMRNLNGPYQFREREFEIHLTEPNIVVNIYNFLYTATHKNLIIADPTRLVSENFKSGTILTLCTCIVTYGELFNPEEHMSCDRISNWGTGYRLEIPVAQNLRCLVIMPSILDAWP